MEGLHVYESFVAEDHEGLFEKLKGIEWRTVLWGRAKKSLPRLVYKAASSSDPLYVLLGEVIHKLESDFACKVTGMWGNYFRSGKDYCPYHRDDYGCKVFCLVLGNPRKVNFKHNDTGKVISILPQPGDMYMFEPGVNDHYTHAVPKTTKTEERISILFFVNSI